MFEHEPTIHLAKGMAGIAMSAMLLGMLLISATNWQVPGWVIVTYGVLILFLSHHIRAAPCLDEPESDEITRAPHKTDADSEERAEELLAEALANYRI